MMKACIFDLDGTLGDTRESLVYSVGLTLREMGLPGITNEQCISFVGNGARYLIEHSLEAVGAATRLEEGMEVYGRIFDENCTYKVEPYDGIMETLRDMKDRGMKLAVLSNKPHRQTVKVVDAMCGRDMFCYIQGQKEGIPRKPDPAGIYHALKVMGEPLGDCLYVGDSEVDAVTGRNAGIKTICVSWGFRTKGELKAAGAEYIIDKAEHLLQFV
ncbi:MAG: HAD-IA family hydrolase [Lachnospiraceae bacterium]